MGYIVDLETNTIRQDENHIENDKAMKPNTYDKIKEIVSEQNNEYDGMKQSKM